MLDFIGLFPCELIALPIPDPATRTAALLYLRLPHVIRVIRIQGFFSVEEKRLNQRCCVMCIIYIPYYTSSHAISKVIARVGVVFSRAVARRVKMQPTSEIIVICMLTNVIKCLLSIPE